MSKAHDIQMFQVGWGTAKMIGFNKCSGTRVTEFVLTEINQISGQVTIQ